MSSSDTQLASDRWPDMRVSEVDAMRATCNAYQALVHEFVPAGVADPLEWMRETLRRAAAKS